MLGQGPGRHRRHHGRAGPRPRDRRLSAPPARPLRAPRSTLRSAALAAALWACVLVARTAASRHPAVVEDLYARRLYPAVALAVSFMTGRLPFSLAEVGLVAGLVALAWGSVRFLVRWRSRPPGSLVRGLVRIVAVAGAVVLAFDVLWGFTAGPRISRPWRAI
ncbi:MAG: hypothetical protein DMF77_06260 [Acidobacteria bacterium]|nr:MAG: hypothetical protein DMF77_06260 [Acidobacteriota bacterium]